MIIVVMGVAGAGKTAVGTALAASLGWPFLDADSYHPAANVAKMSGGAPLSDDDREPWLAALQDLLARLHASSTDAVLACSALRADFRNRLAAAGHDVVFVHLRVSPAVAARRVRNRSGHFMPGALVETQFEALETPSDAIEVNGEGTVDDVVRSIRARLF